MPLLPVQREKLYVGVTICGQSVENPSKIAILIRKTTSCDVMETETLCVGSSKLWGAEQTTMMTRNNILTLRHINRKRGNEKCNHLQSRCYWFTAWFLSPISTWLLSQQDTEAWWQQRQTLIHHYLLIIHTHALLKYGIHTLRNFLCLLPGHWHWKSKHTDGFCSLLLSRHDWLLVCSHNNTK